MNIYELILKIVSVLIWPTVIVIAVWQIKKALGL